MSTRNGSMSRTEASRRITGTLAAMTNKRLPYRAPDGTFPLVIALPHEHASEVIARLGHFDGKANVAVAFTKNFEVVVIEQETPPGVEQTEINKDLSMGMFLVKVNKSPGRRMGFRFKGVTASVPAGRQQLQYA